MGSAFQMYISIANLNLNGAVLKDTNGKPHQIMLEGGFGVPLVQKKEDEIG